MNYPPTACWCTAPVWGGARGGLQLTWFDRSGKSPETVGEPGAYEEVTLSPDGTRAAASRADPHVDIWPDELARGTSTRLTFDPAVDRFAVWSPDGKRIAFVSSRNGIFDLYQKPSDGAGNEAILYQSKEAKTLTDWSQDGRFLLY